MELTVIAIVAIVAMFTLLFGFIYIFEKQQLMCAEKDSYIETLEEENEILKEFIERNEEKWSN